jgi:GNAT superfamily N-acetyltransferase
MLYVKELPEDRRTHGAFHRAVVNVFEPKPSITLAKLYSRHGQLVPVRWDSPQPVRRRLADMSRVIKREFGCDFTMYSETGDPGDGYLIAEPDGRAVGGFVVRWIEFSNAPAQWILSWVWVVPSHRRRGLMQTVWLMVVGKYPGIDPEIGRAMETMLFSPMTHRNVRLKNRIVLSPMLTYSASTDM